MNTSSYIVSYKDTLFESVSYEPWSLEYKMVFTETRMALTEALQDLHAWYTTAYSVKLLEAEAPDQVLARFKALPALSPDHVQKLKAQFDNPNAPPPGLLNKVFNAFKRGLTRISQLTYYPPVEDKIQNLIVKLKAKHPEDKTWKKIIQGFLTFSQKGGWVSSVVLLALGAASMLLSLPWLSTSIIPIGLTVALLRMVGDLVNGKSVTYAFGKAVALGAIGAGVGAGAKALGLDEHIAKLWDMIRPTVEAAEAATPPATINTGADSPEVANEPAAEPATPATEPATPATSTTDTRSGELADTPPGRVSPEDLQRLERGNTIAIEVKPGDTLSQLAQKHQVSVADIMQINPQITVPDVIKAGDMIRIPPITNQPPYAGGVGLPRRR